MAASAKGWAVKNAADEILVATVSPLRVGAIVNFFALSRGLMLPRVRDDTVELCWEAESGHNKLVEVVITEVEP